jgi:integrase
METTVYVVEVAGRATYQLKWVDPNSGRWRWKSTDIEVGGSRAKKRAEELAAQMRVELSSGVPQVSDRVTWADFTDRYLRQRGGGMRASSQAKVRSVFNIVERLRNPRYVSSIDEQAIGDLVERLRKGEGLPNAAKGEALVPRSEESIASFMGTLKAALRWAAQNKLIRACPAFTSVRRPKKSRGFSRAKGRPVTAEEFERMLGKTAAVVGEANAVAWRFFLRGLWAGGLRLAEAVAFDWEDVHQPQPLLDTDPPVIWMPGDFDKSGHDREMPMDYEFAELLAEVPVEKRVGRVFHLPGIQGDTSRVTPEWAGRIVSRIGERAGVIVATTKGGKKKYASAHDLRRSFGHRLVAMGTPVDELKELMRHESLDTTFRYYVGQTAREIGARGRERYLQRSEAEAQRAKGRQARHAK